MTFDQVKDGFPLLYFVRANGEWSYGKLKAG